jgi:hypothetical protein
MGNSWNDGHMDSIGESILGLSIVLLIAIFSLWPLALAKDRKGGGGCCKAIDKELNNER